MSRSYRHTPIVKCDHDSSNREFKIEAHQKFRRKVRAALNHAIDDLGEGDPEFPINTDAVFPQHMREVSEIWCSHQEYKSKEFGDFWRRRRLRHELDAVVYPESYARWHRIDRRNDERWYRRVHYK